MNPYKEDQANRLFLQYLGCLVLVFYVFVGQIQAAPEDQETKFRTNGFITLSNEEPFLSPSELKEIKDLFNQFHSKGILNTGKYGKSMVFLLHYRANSITSEITDYSEGEMKKFPTCLKRFVSNKLVKMPGIKEHDDLLIELALIDNFGRKSSEKAYGYYVSSHRDSASAQIWYLFNIAIAVDTSEHYFILETKGDEVLAKVEVVPNNGYLIDEAHTDIRHSASITFSEPNTLSERKLLIARVLPTFSEAKDPFLKFCKNPNLPRLLNIDGLDFHQLLLFYPAYMIMRAVELVNVLKYWGLDKDLSEQTIAAAHLGAAFLVAFTFPYSIKMQNKIIYPLVYSTTHSILRLLALDKLGEVLISIFVLDSAYQTLTDEHFDASSYLAVLNIIPLASSVLDKVVGLPYFARILCSSVNLLYYWTSQSLFKTQMQRAFARINAGIEAVYLVTYIHASATHKELE